MKALFHFKIMHTLIQNFHLIVVVMEESNDVESMKDQMLKGSLEA